MSGKEIAEKMLTDNHIYDVKVVSVKGQLTDHYNPKNKTANLSEAVYNERNAAAAAVAAHECGHAVQHAVFIPMVKFTLELGPCSWNIFKICIFSFNCRYFHGKFVPCLITGWNFIVCGNCCFQWDYFTSGV